MSRDQRVLRSPAATRRDRAVSVLAALLLAVMALAALLVGPRAEADQERPVVDGEAAGTDQEWRAVQASSVSRSQLFTT